MKTKKPTIAELRQELSESGTKALDFGYKFCSPNHYRVLTENLERALRPLNHEYDALVIPGWNSGILPARFLRAWLPFAPAPVLDVEVRPDCVVISAERTRATFKRGAYVPMFTKPKFENGKFVDRQAVNLLIKMPLEYALVAPGPRPTRSELMTILNKERGKILGRRRSWLRDLKSFSPQYRAGRLESIERDTKNALTALYRAFGRMQSKQWAEFVTPGYLDDSRGLPEKCQALYAEIVAFRDVHNVTASALFQKTPVLVSVKGE